MDVSLTGQLDADTTKLRDLVLSATHVALQMATSRLRDLGGFALCAQDSGAQVLAMANGLGQVGSDVEFLFGNWTMEIHEPFEELDPFLEAHIDRYPAAVVERFAAYLSVLKRLKEGEHFAKCVPDVTSFVLAVAGIDPSAQIAAIQYDSVRLLSHPTVWARLQTKLANGRTT